MTAPVSHIQGCGKQVLKNQNFYLIGPGIITKSRLLKWVFLDILCQTLTETNADVCQMDHQKTSVRFGYNDNILIQEKYA